MRKILPIVALLSSFNCYAANDFVKLNPIQVLVEHVDKIPDNHVETKSAMCTASANAASGFANQPINVSGYVSYTITNGSTVSQNYWVDEYMCVNGYGCTHIRNTVSLGAHLSGSGGGTIYNTETLGKGTYVDQASIQVTGESNCFTQGSNTVFIS